MGNEAPVTDNPLPYIKMAAAASTSLHVLKTNISRRKSQDESIKAANPSQILELTGGSSRNRSMELAGEEIHSVWKNNESTKSTRKNRKVAFFRENDPNAEELFETTKYKIDMLGVNQKKVWSVSPL